MTKSTNYFSLPFLLIYSRLLSALIIVVLLFFASHFEQLNKIIVYLMFGAIISDIFDGIIARKWNISSDTLRLWDSNVDQIFWIVTIVSIFYLNFTFLLKHWLGIGLVVFLEVLAYVICALKFRKPIATHSILAKFFTLSLFFFLADLAWNQNSFILYCICLILALVSRIEIVAIIISLDNWAMDVPSWFSVRKINAGIPIKKNKLFNS